MDNDEAVRSHHHFIVTVPLFFRAGPPLALPARPLDLFSLDEMST